MINFEFEPDCTRAKFLDKRMHEELGQSLQHVSEACAGKIEFDEQALQSVIENLKQGRAAKPSTFALYYQLVLAIEAQAFEKASAIFGQLHNAPYMDENFEIVTLGSPSFSACNTLYKDMMNADGEISFEYPEDEVAENFKVRLKQGFALLDATIPELSAEIRAIIRQVVIAGSDPKSEYQFDGGSHYQLWGALFLNGLFHPDEIAVAEVLAHETAHSLLFGFCVDEPLVFNDDNELYASPLRRDPRPMDGIYHATFVSARMHWAMSRMATSDRLTNEQKDQAREAAARDIENFNEGYSVVAEHGRMSNVGIQLMKSAKRYIDKIQ